MSAFPKLELVVTMQDGTTHNGTTRPQDYLAFEQKFTDASYAEIFVQDRANWTMFLAFLVAKRGGFSGDEAAFAQAVDDVVVAKPSEAEVPKETGSPAP